MPGRGRRARLTTRARAWRPPVSAARSQNVYTGNYASSGRGVARDTDSGVVAAGRGGTVGNAYTGREVSGGSGTIYNPNTGTTTACRGISGDNGRVVSVNGDIYAGHDGNVYRHTENGWEQRGDGGLVVRRSNSAENRAADQSQVDRSQAERARRGPRRRPIAAGKWKPSASIANVQRERKARGATRATSDRWAPCAGAAAAVADAAAREER